MHSIKILYILIITSFLYSQTYFDRIFGGDVQFGDARSMALANSYATTGSASSITSRNPARLSYLAKGQDGVLIDFQFNLRSYYERRSIDLLDSFGDFLNESDYVSNQHGHFYNSLGFIVSRQSLFNEKLKFGIGLSLMPIASFNYDYKEEVRFRNTDVDTPEDTGIVDAALGFHVYSNKGTINLASIGFSVSHNESQRSPLAIGLSVNQLLSTTITDQIAIDTVYNSINPNVYENLSSFESINQSIQTKTKYYAVASIEAPLFSNKNSSMIFSYEPQVLIRSSNMESFFNISNLSGLPYFSNYNQQDNIYNLELNGIQYFKPRKMILGFRINELQYSGSLMIFEIIKEFFSKHELSYLSDNNENLVYKLNDVIHCKIAFEHKFILGNSIRMGLAYKTALINQLNPVTNFTMGSNKRVNKNLDIDFALSYHITNYRYDDIFPSSSPNGQTNCNEYCEKINESNMSISTTFKWEF